ncbi:hypothetical protein [Hymenobacter cheonanensis]|uniref:hypothetical protein n=1 Tax=Hymenobacter sp. CA2-7 TaxID=3063993 RepID=UPI0027125320|nr:hypothetical protein [Hymenobacter sp. CA2-7]MDO7886634.1 hypothetical protein [Hymenobacter sp. CA2-7]
MADDSKQSSGLNDFEIKQYDVLRAEIDADVAETRLLERIALAGTGAVWTWLATVKDSGQRFVADHPIVWLIPAFFALLGGLRCLALLHYILLRAAYIRKMEAAAPRSSEQLIGWETYLQQMSGKGLRVSSGAVAIWVILFTVSVWVARQQGWLSVFCEDCAFWSLFVILLLIGRIGLSTVNSELEKVLNTK